MTLQATYDKKEDIPSEYVELFSERGGKWECTGITGMKTSADVERVQTALTKERDDHKATKAKLAPFADLGDPEEVQAKLDKIPELEAAAKGKLDEAAIDEIVERRVEGALRSKVAPVERQLKKVETERDELKTAVEDLSGKDQRRRLGDALRPVASKLGVLPEYLDDAMMHAERIFEPTEDGGFATRDGVGVTPGLAPTDWLTEFVEKRPRWLGDDVSGGATGTRTTAGGGANPWKADGWNITAQGQFVREHGMEKATAAAKAAGVVVGATRPAATK